MTNDSFDRFVSRAGLSTLKETLTPDGLKEKRLLSYQGAEFEFPTAKVFSDGVIRLAQNGLFGFTLQDEDYNSHVVWWMENVRNSHIDPDWILPTHGVIYGLAEAMRCFLTKGKKLLTFTPGYSRHKQAADRQNMDTIQLPMTYEKGIFSYDFSLLDMTMQKGNIGLMVFSNPHNPTGRIMDREELKILHELSLKYQVPVYMDEIFGEISFKEPIPVASSLFGQDTLMISATSLGKAFSLTGVNHANLLIPHPVIRKKMQTQRLADHYGSIDPMLRAGLISSYSPEGKAFVNDLTVYVKENIRLLKEAVETYLPGAKVLMPEGTFCFLVDYSMVGLTLQELKAFLEKEACFVGDPGEDYGLSPWFYRYSAAVPRAAVLRSIEVLKKASKEREWVDL